MIVSLTGPGASLGIPAENTIRLWPGELGGQKINLIVLNDATDTTTAVKNATKLITEDKVDLIVGPSLTPTSLAVIDAAARSGVPVISLAGGGAIVEPQDGPRRWAFKMAPTETISINAVLDHMLKNKATTVATIGITTAYGEGFSEGDREARAGQGREDRRGREVRAGRHQRHPASARGSPRTRRRLISSAPARRARCRRSSSSSAATRG